MEKKYFIPIKEGTSKKYVVLLATPLIYFFYVTDLFWMSICTILVLLSQFICFVVLDSDDIDKEIDPKSESGTVSTEETALYDNNVKEVKKITNIVVCTMIMDCYPIICRLILDSYLFPHYEGGYFVYLLITANLLLNLAFLAFNIRDKYISLKDKSFDELKKEYDEKKRLEQYNAITGTIHTDTENDFVIKAQSRLSFLDKEYFISELECVSLLDNPWQLLFKFKNAETQSVVLNQEKCSLYDLKVIYITLLNNNVPLDLQSFETRMDIHYMEKPSIDLRWVFIYEREQKIVFPDRIVDFDDVLEVSLIDLSTNEPIMNTSVDTGSMLTRTIGGALVGGAIGALAGAATASKTTTTTNMTYSNYEVCVMVNDLSNPTIRISVWSNIDAGRRIVDTLSVIIKRRNMNNAKND